MTEEEAALRRNYPACFTSAMMPLKLNIHLDLGLTYPDPTLDAWTHSPVYLRNCLKPNARRIDLQGNYVPEAMTYAEKVYAWERLMWLRHDCAGRDWRQLSADQRREVRLSMPKKPKNNDSFQRREKERE